MSTTSWQPSTTYQKVAEANRQYYAQTAAMYEATETCVTDPLLQRGLESDLDRALATLGKPLASVRALDACSGSGNVALKLLRRGVGVTLVDISPDLQEIFRAKCVEAGFVPKVVCSELAAFLAVEGEPYDLVTLSSALHHLENIDEVLRLAFARLAPGGLLMTAFDPTLRAQRRNATRLLQRADYYAWKAMHQSGDFVPGVWRRLRRIAGRWTANEKHAAPLNAATAGMLAEYHVDRGIDDLGLLRTLREFGFEVVHHDRYVEGRFALVRNLIARLGDATGFKMLLRKPVSSA